MEGIEVRPYTRIEAEAAVEGFFILGSQVRHKILELHERRADKALAYGTFEEFARDRLGADWSDGYLRQLRMWASVERQVLVNLESQRLTKSMAEQLARLPEEKRKQAYEEVSVLKADNPIHDMKHIVNRMLGASDHYGKKAEKIVEQEVDIPVGAVVDVHTGRPVIDEPAEELPIVTRLPESRMDEFIQAARDNDAPVVDEDTPIPADTPSHDISEFDKLFDYTPPTKKPEEGWLSDEAVARLNQFRAFWKLDSDVQTIEKIISQLYTTYSNKPNFAKLAE